MFKQTDQTMRLDQQPAYSFSRLFGPSEPDPTPPEPTPFPIRIVPDAPAAGEEVAAEPEKGKSSDYFYPAWDKFLAVQSTRAKTTTKTAKKLKQEKELVEEKQPEGLQTRENAAKSWQEAAKECREKVAAIVEECKRLNQKYRDALFDLEQNPYCLQGLTGRVPGAVADIEEPPWIKRVEDIFDDPKFFVEGATANDIHQGNAGDCWFLAALMAVSAKKELIDHLCVAKDEKVGVYGFVFYRDGEWIYEVIDDKLYMRVGDDDDLSIVRDWSQSKKKGIYIRHDEEKLKESLQRGGEALYFSHCKSNETWLPLIEKAYAKAHGDYSSIEGGFPSEGIEDLTGGVATVINPEDVMDKDLFWKEQLSRVNEKYLFGGGTKPKDGKGIIGGHAYAVLQAWEEGDLRLLKLRNPWAKVEWEGDWSDGSKLWTPDMMTKLGHTFGDDGVFWMSYKDFFKHFPSINRVRLFDESWQVTQRWTCVNVPWTVDYLDTRFELTVTGKGPVVIVLSQPDDRYFYGLRGRYLFSLHFRFYRKNETGHKYLVRSLHNSGNESVFTRSVSAELDDLEPGKYYVLFKITATRTNQQSGHEAVLKYAIDRKDKLLQAGRRFDYAQTKGNLRAMEKQDRREKRAEKWDKAISAMRRNRKYNVMERERAALRKKRIEAAMNEKRKALHESLVERRKQRKEKQKERMEGKKPVMSDKSSPANASESTDEGKLTPATTIADATQGVAQDDTDKLAHDVAKLEVSATDADKTTDESQTTAGAESTDNAPINATAEATKTTETAVGTSTESKVTTEGPSETVSSEKANDPVASSPLPQPEAAPVESKEEISLSDAPPRPMERSETQDVSLNGDDDDEEDMEWEEPPEQIDDLEDNDFAWNSDMDGPVNSDTSTRSTTAGNDIDIFGDDPWCALCVVGLRVYSKCIVKIGIRTTDDEDEEVEEEV